MGLIPGQTERPTTGERRYRPLISGREAEQNLTFDQSPSDTNGLRLSGSDTANSHSCLCLTFALTPTLAHSARPVTQRQWLQRPRTDWSPNSLEFPALLAPALHCLLNVWYGGKSIGIACLLTARPYTGCNIIPVRDWPTLDYKSS